MDLTFSVVAAPGKHDNDILAFIKDNDNDFYPPIAARKDLSVFVQGVYTDDGKYILCYHNGRIVGLTTILFNHFQFLTYYHYIAIDREYRHRGIGSLLYSMVTTMCEEHHAQWAIVKTWSKNMISQSMFRKHGFSHAATIEDDRSPGVHSYLFIRPFSRIRFQKPVTCLCIVGGGVGIVNFMRTLFAITKDTSDGGGQLSFVVINDPGLLVVGSSQAMNEFNRNVPVSASHLMYTDVSFYATGQFRQVSYTAECPDMYQIVKSIFNDNSKKWLMACAGAEQLAGCWNLEHVILPADSDLVRLDEIVRDIACGYTTPAYYKEELASMARKNNCQGLFIGGAELHGVFGIDRVYNGMHVFDPLLELAIIVQSNRTQRK